MSVLEYVGRTIDLLAYSGARTGAGEVQLTMALAQPGEGGQITTGIQKLSQRVLLEALTEKGSLRYLPLRGCDFMREARLGFFQTPMDVLASFSASLVDIQQNLQAEESDDDPADERFASAEILAVTLVDGNASVTVRVLSLAGTSRDIIAPLSVTV